MAMQALWKKAVVVLVAIIAVLQVIHMALLSRLEARKSYKRREAMNKVWDSGPRVYREAEIKEDRAQMLEAIHQSSVLDSSGEFHIVNFLIGSDALRPRSRVKRDLSVVTQSTINSLHHLDMLSASWQGPISAAIFSLSEDIPLVVETILQLRRCFPAVRHNCSFHLVFPLNGPNNDKAPSSLNPMLDSCDHLVSNLQKTNLGKNYALGVAYPNNLLRNVARRSAQTEFVLVIDIDMIPNERLHNDFLTFAHEKRLFGDSNKDDKTVYVLPAFEMREGPIVPKDKQGVLQMVERMDVRPFYFELCWKCQKHTDYEAWQREPPNKKLDVLFEVLWRDPWEPFYISRNNVPLYDERFRQYGFNRISQVCELHVAGYKFSVLNNGFVIHRGLKTALSFHKDKELDQERNRVLFRQFKTELKEKYPDSSRKCY